MQTIAEVSSTELIQLSESQLLELQAPPHNSFKMNQLMIVALFAIIGFANCGVIHPAAYVSPFASTYNAHTINHAVAAPIIAAPAAKLVASPYVASPYIASPYASAAYAASPYIAASPYSSPYSLPYSSPYSAPYAYSNYFL